MYSSFDVLHTEYIVNNISKFSIYLKKIQCFRHKDTLRKGSKFIMQFIKLNQ